MHCGPDEPTLFDFSDNATRQFIHSLVLFQKAYAPIHGRICVCLCLFGVLTNLIHCVVLTRPQMRQSAVNAIMTAVALCDLGTMGSYLVYIWHFVLGDHSCANAQTRLWMFFLLLHIFLSILLHTATLWLAVLMAFLRRMTLHKNTLYSNWQRVPLARRASLGVVFAVFLLCIPSLAVHQVIEYPHHRWQPSPLCSAEKFAAMPNYSEPLFTVVIRPSALANGCWLFKGNLWLTGICFKVIPCLLLLVLSASLLQKLRRAERKRCMLLLSQIGNGTQNERAPSADVTQQMQNGPAGLKKINSDRTTALLLAILCVFLLTEMPQGLIAILNAVYTADVHRFIYLTLGDVLDLLSLLNSSVNFVLYCLMSSRYRQTFCSLFLPIQACKRCVAQAQSIPLPPSFQSQQPPLPPPNPLENGQQQHEMAQSTDERGNHGFLAIGHRQRRRRSTPAYRWLRAGSQQSALSARDMEELSQRLGGRERSPALQQRLQQLKEENQQQHHHHMSSMQHLLKPNAGF